MVGTTGAAGRGAGRGTAGATGAAAVRVPAGAAGAGACEGSVNVGAPAVGPPGGSVGNLIVGAAEGLGGKLMRTVSFLGWTLAPSGGLGGTAPPGKLGLLSAIILSSQVKVTLRRCQTLIDKGNAPR